jgi:4'-phosphopantetheinyl transferase
MIVHEAASRVWVTIRPAVVLRPLSADVRAARAMPAWRAREFLAGRSALRDLLAQVRPAAAAAPVVPGGNGKPLLAGHSDIGINVSHDSGHVAACVAIGRMVGVDVQSPPERLSSAMVRRCAADLSALPEVDQPVEFAWIWTAQEACVKVTGAGVSGRPWSIGVRPGARGGTWRAVRWRGLRELSGVPLSCAWEDTG